jgi:hypothetical protein
MVCLKVLIFLFIHSLFNFSGEHFLHSSNVEFRIMDVVDDIMIYIEISLVYWNNQSSYSSPSIWENLWFLILQCFYS